jgi:hypothetical protein
VHATERLGRAHAAEARADHCRAGNFTLALVPIFGLGMIQLLFFLYGGFFGILARLGLARPIRRVNQPKMLLEAKGNGRYSNGKGLEGKG